MGTRDKDQDFIIQRANILGVGISAIRMMDAIRQIGKWISENTHQYVCVTGVHGVIESQRSEQLRAIHNQAGMVTPDGMPLVWLSRLRGFPNVERVYGPDLMLAVCTDSISKGYRHFFYGGAEGIPEKLTSNLKSLFPNLQVVGEYSPPFRPLSADENKQIINKINATYPDILWIGLSTPKQEYWMAKNLGEVNAKVMIGVGAAFDFHARVKPQAPLWMQQNGLEWLFRLLTEPRRLWRRYLINNPTFVALIIAQWLGIRKYQI